MPDELVILGENVAEAGAALARLRDRLAPDTHPLLDALLRSPDSSLAELAVENGWERRDVNATWRRIRRQAGRQ